MRSSKLSLSKISENTNTSSTKSQLITSTLTKKPPVRPKTAESSLSIGKTTRKIYNPRGSLNAEEDEFVRNSPIENEYKMKVTELFNDSKLFEHSIKKSRASLTTKDSSNSSTDSSSDSQANAKRFGSTRAFSAKTHSSNYYELKNSFSSSNRILPSLANDPKLTSTPTSATRRMMPPSFAFHQTPKSATVRKKSPTQARRALRSDSQGSKRLPSCNQGQMSRGACSDHNNLNQTPDRREETSREYQRESREESCSLQGVDRIEDITLTNSRNQVYSAPLARSKVRFLSKLVDGVNSFEDNINEPSEGKSADYYYNDDSLDSNSNTDQNIYDSPQPAAYTDDLEDERNTLQESIMMLREKLKVIEKKEKKRIKRHEPPTQSKVSDNKKSILREQKPIKTQSMSVDKWVEIHKRRNSANLNVAQAKPPTGRPQTSVGIVNKTPQSPLNKSQVPPNRQPSITPSANSGIEKIAGLENYLQELRNRNKRRLALKKSQIKYGDVSAIATSEDVGRRTRSSMADPSLDSRASSSAHPGGMVDEAELTLSRRELIDMTVLDKMQDRIKHELQENLRTIRKIQTQNEFNAIVAKIKNFLNEVEDFKYRNVVNHDFRNRRFIKLYEYEYKV